jgi:parallel beta-helix repeat protein
MATQGCGDEITQDTTLDGDLTCPTGPALVIAADNVTLDLGGHTVSGDPNAPDGGPGILLRGVSGCTVRNGTVQHFGAGVVISGGARNVVEHVTAQDNIGPSGGDFGDGIVVSKSKENRIRRNTVRRNGPYSGISLVEECDGNDVRDNVVTDNNMMHVGDPSAGRQAMGIRIEGPAANNNKVVRNTVTGSGSSGITVLPTCINMDSCAGTAPNEHNEIAHNTASHNGTSGRGDGIMLFNVPNPVAPTQNTIMHNVADHNVSNGIAVDAGATKNHIGRNRGRGNGQYDGFDGNTTPACDANKWEANNFGLVNQPCARAPEATAASGLQAQPSPPPSVSAQG